MTKGIPQWYFIVLNDQNLFFNFYSHDSDSKNYFYYFLTIYLYDLKVDFSSVVEFPKLSRMVN